MGGEGEAEPGGFPSEAVSEVRAGPGVLPREAELEVRAGPGILPSEAGLWGEGGAWRSAQALQLSGPGPAGPEDKPGAVFCRVSEAWATGQP